MPSPRPPEGSTGPETTRISRRSVLGAVAGATLAGTAGCVRQARALLNRGRPSQVSLSIKTVPADADPRATHIAQFLREQLHAVGIAAKVVPTSRENLLRDVLVNQRFDLYVGRFPGRADPDFLRGLLHSRFAVEPGWQNPFGYADLDVDRLLERQRRQDGSHRRQTLVDLQHEIASAQPFTVVAFADEVRATGTDQVTGWTQDVHAPLGYLALERQDRSKPVDMALTDVRALENLNPLAVAFRDEGTITGLLYDPLGRRIDGQVRSWLAASWRWLPTDDDGPALDVRLREDLRWHDGTPITADDVAFTYRFLRDTSLGRLDSPVPAPRFRGPVSLVTDATVVDERTARLQFNESSRPVARRALTVPVLPAHVWTEKAREATVAGVETGRAVTEALVWSNRSPVGSGRLRLSKLRVRESLALEPFEDHFLTWADDPHLRPYHGEFGLGRLTFQRAPSPTAAVSMVRSGDADATASDVLPGNVPAIGRDADLQLHVDRDRGFYHVGFNTRQRPLGNPRFRRAIARLLDRAYLVETVFSGYAAPATSPLARHDALAPDLAWTDGGEGEDPVLPFPGQNGRLDVQRARRAFRNAGYRYSDDGKLLAS